MTVSRCMDVNVINTSARAEQLHRSASPGRPSAPSSSSEAHVEDAAAADGGAAATTGRSTWMNQQEGDDEHHQDGWRKEKTGESRSKLTILS